jgi:hypothetical protein
MPTGADDVFHIELRQGSRMARAFNLARADLELRILAPWARGESVELDERRWEPVQTRLLIYACRRLHTGELTLGRGWQNATKFGTDVTQSLLAGSREPEAGASSGAGGPPGIEVSPAEFGRQIQLVCANRTVGTEELAPLLADRLGHRRASERLAVAEQALWELLHRGRVRLVRAGEPVPRAEWQVILLAWETWTGTAFPPITVEDAE